MNVKLVLIADAANTTADGKLNVLGVFDSIGLPKLPSTYPYMVVICQIEAFRAEFGKDKELKLILQDQDAIPVWEHQLNFTVNENHKGPIAEFGLILPVVNVEFSNDGDHRFVLLINDDHKGDARLRVRIEKEEENGD